MVDGGGLENHCAGNGIAFLFLRSYLDSPWDSREVASSSGQVGAPATVTNTVTASTLQLTGVWNVGHRFTNETGTCAGSGNDPLNTFISDGQTTVSSSGSFTYPVGFPGSMNLSGTVGCSAVVVTPGMLSASGTCSSSTACSGTISATPGGGTESGTITWSR